MIYCKDSLCLGALVAHKSNDLLTSQGYKVWEYQMPRGAEYEMPANKNNVTLKSFWNKSWKTFLTKQVFYGWIVIYYNDDISFPNTVITIAILKNIPHMYFTYCGQSIVLAYGIERWDGRVRKDRVKNQLVRTIKCLGRDKHTRWQSYLGLVDEKEWLELQPKKPLDFGFDN